MSSDKTYLCIYLFPQRVKKPIVGVRLEAFWVDKIVQLPFADKQDVFVQLDSTTCLRHHPCCAWELFWDTNTRTSGVQRTIIGTSETRSKYWKGEKFITCFVLIIILSFFKFFVYSSFLRSESLGNWSKNY